jgi:serine/threonine-protein kinase
MVSVMLNPQGRLVELAAMPAQYESAEPAQASFSFDWRALFTAAGLDMSRFAPANAAWRPPSAFDARAAWTGAYPGTAIPLRIEAASWRGRPVHFRMIGPWNPMSNKQPSDSQVRRGAFLDDVTYRIVFQVALLAIGCLFAWRNVRLGKGDLQGAFRLAAFIFLLHLAAWPFVTSWASDSSEIDAIFNQLARALFNAGILWTYYVALEPYVRRRWPQSLIAWSRLLAGGFRDPVVGANVLIGAANGVVISAYFLARNLLVHSYFSQGGPLALATVTGAGFVSEILGTVGSRILSAFVCLFLFFLLRVLFRSEWIAAAVFTLVVMLVIPRSPNYPLLSLALNFIPSAVIIVLTIRLGLLAMIASFVASDITVHFPVTTDLSTWYAFSALLAYALIFALAGYAFHSALAGRALFRAGFLEEA